MFTTPTVVTSDDINKRSYITFYFNDKRIREYNGNSIGIKINPNRSYTITERSRLLEELQFEFRKALTAGEYPKPIEPRTNSLSNKPPLTAEASPVLHISTETALFTAMKIKLRSALSKKYKRNLKSVYRQFRSFINDEEKKASLASLKLLRIEQFLSQFGSSGTYYMNKRRDLGVLLSAAGKAIDQAIPLVSDISKRKVKATLHEKYEQEQLKPILSYLKTYNTNLYLCCLLTYSSWLRPHEEIRLLTKGNFNNDFSQVRLSGDENKGGKVRVVYIPEYVQVELRPLLVRLDRQDNIFTKNPIPFNDFYFTTKWNRIWPKMFEKGLVFENQTIYSFRHTAAVSIYRKTKDVFLLQKLLGHSDITVTLKYLRTLGEVNSDELKEAAPQLE